MKTYLILSISGLAWVISLIVAFHIGKSWHKITAKIEAIEAKLEEKTADIPLEPEPEHKSSIIDPNNAIEVAQWEQDEMIRKINK